MAVVLPIPLGPRIPVIIPFLGVGSLYRRKVFSPYWWTISSFSSSARPMILMAEKVHLLMQIPHPWHSVSEMMGLPLSPKVMTSTPVLIRGQNFAHSLLHFLF